MIPRIPLLLTALALAGCATAAGPVVRARPGGVLLADRFDGENGGVVAVNYEYFRHWTGRNVGLANRRDEEGLAAYLGGTAATLTSRATFDLVPGVYQLVFRVAGGLPENTLIVRLGSWSAQVPVPAFSPFREEVHTIRIRRRVRTQLSFHPEGAASVEIDDVVLRRIAE